jgi:hypothetical protein
MSLEKANYLNSLYTAITLKKKKKESREFLLVLAGACQVTVKDHFYITGVRYK